MQRAPEVARGLDIASDKPRPAQRALLLQEQRQPLAPAQQPAQPAGPRRPPSPHAAQPQPQQREAPARAPEKRAAADKPLQAVVTPPASVQGREAGAQSFAQALGTGSTTRSLPDTAPPGSISASSTPPPPPGAGPPIERSALCLVRPQQQRQRWLQRAQRRRAAERAGPRAQPRQPRDPPARLAGP